MEVKSAFASFPIDLAVRVFKALEPNEQPITGRLICKEASAQLTQQGCNKACFSLPLPPAVTEAVWQQHLQREFNLLTLRNKFRALAAAAASGSQLNLHVAWGLLRPCLSETDLYASYGDGTPYFEGYRPAADEDPGVAALRAGHLELLPWLLEHRCPVNKAATLAAAAEHGSLEDLQRVRALLGRSKFWPGDVFCLAEAAGRSDDGYEKIYWMSSSLDNDAPPDERSKMCQHAANGSAAAGQLLVGIWGAPRNTLKVALRAGQLAVADQLVGQRGHDVWQEMWGEGAAFEAALGEVWRGAGSRAGLDVVQWLLRRGVPLRPVAIAAAAGGGQLEAVQYLHGECGLPLKEEVFAAAAGSGSLPTMEWLREQHCPMDSNAYRSARDPATVVWLAGTAGCPLPEGGAPVVNLKMCAARGVSSSALMEAVKALVGAGCPPERAACIAGAAYGGHLPLVRYLHEELGVGFGPDTLAEGARGGCVPVVEYLVAAGCQTGNPGDERSLMDSMEHNPYYAAVKNGDRATMECLHRLGVRRPDPWLDESIAMILGQGAGGAGPA